MFIASRQQANDLIKPFPHQTMQRQGGILSAAPQKHDFFLCSQVWAFGADIMAALRLIPKSSRKFSFLHYIMGILLIVINTRELSRENGVPCSEVPSQAWSSLVKPCPDSQFISYVTETQPITTKKSPILLLASQTSQG
jgi:hypothetical protein